MSDPNARQVLANVRIPVSMLQNPESFGETRIGDCLVGELELHGGRLSRLVPVDPLPDRQPIVLLPRLTEAHVHLDKCHTINRLNGVGGDLAAAGRAMQQDRVNWTEPDIRERAERGLRELLRAGCGTVRTHIDWSWGADVLQPPLAWHVLTELAEAHSGDVRLNCAALVGIDELARSGVAHTIAEELARRGAALGAFVFGQAASEHGLRAAFRAASEKGLALDFHVDEGLEPDLRGLELIADIALETRHEGPVLCGHACSLASQPASDVQRTADKLAQAGIIVVSLPATNLYLQGRAGGTPDRRGVTQIHELRAAGVRMIVGTDNVGDAYCPGNRHDPFHTLGLACIAAHMDPPVGQWLPMIAQDASLGLGEPPIWLDDAHADDVIAVQAGGTSDLLGDLSGLIQPLSTILEQPPS